jgi:hypothetical protein
MESVRDRMRESLRKREVSREGEGKIEIWRDKE